MLCREPAELWVDTLMVPGIKQNALLGLQTRDVYMDGPRLFASVSAWC